MIAARRRKDSKSMRRRSIRFQPQASAVECGAACLAMVLSYFGCQTTVRQVRDRLGLGRDGVSALALAKLAQTYGLESKGLHCEPSVLGRLRLPAIAHWGFNHFVVVEKVTSHGVHLVDPAAGRRRVNHEEFGAEFTGVVLTFLPTTSMRRTRHRGDSMLRFLARYIPRRPLALTAIIVFSLILTLISLVPAALTGFTVDQLVPSGASSALTIVTVGVLTVLASQAAVSYARAELLLYLQSHLDTQMMTSFLRHLLMLPFSYFHTRTSGDLLLRLSSNTIIRDLVSTQAITTALDVVSVVLYLTVLLGRAPDYALIVIVVATAQLVLVAFTTRRATDLTNRELGAVSDAQSHMVETIVGIESIKAAGAEQHVYHRWEVLFRNQIGSARSRLSLDNRVDTGLNALRTGMTLGLVLYGAHRVISGGLSLGGMLALGAITGSLLAPLNSLSNTARQLQRVGVHLARIKDVLDELPEQLDTSARRKIRLQGAVEARGITYSYGAQGPPAVREVSLSCPGGSFTAIVGSTGSGKSTLARLLCGLHRPTHGAALFDDVDLTELDLTALRQQCGVVVQDAAVFSGSILGNITITAPDASFDKIEYAARLACLHDEITAMPMGYETRLSEGGLGLSGGQKQRIALARALLARPKVLLLDEATSHLDAYTEAQVHRNLAELDCTRIVIAHRLSTVRRADQIVVMHDGQIVERGNHTQLLTLGGTYSQLVEAQTDEPTIAES
ncbi:peptidase domain-containing ABC transporter [Amycolatopsis sp. NPDC049868]|uniref:peptidase domain-containing ABC transporter n=1 Tax=Amycolatopsis sp. NPDC049868 TaxID=3363934 RepID=UPI0037BA0BB3